MGNDPNLRRRSSFALCCLICCVAFAPISAASHRLPAPRGVTLHASAATQWGTVTAPIAVEITRLTGGDPDSRLGLDRDGKMFVLQPSLGGALTSVLNGSFVALRPDAPGIEPLTLRVSVIVMEFEMNFVPSLRRRVADVVMEFCFPDSDPPAARVLVRGRAVEPTPQPGHLTSADPVAQAAVEDCLRKLLLSETWLRVTAGHWIPSWQLLPPQENPSTDDADAPCAPSKYARTVFASLQSQLPTHRPGVQLHVAPFKFVEDGLPHDLRKDEAEISSHTINYLRRRLALCYPNLKVHVVTDTTPDDPPPIAINGTIESLKLARTVIPVPIPWILGFATQGHVELSARIRIAYGSDPEQQIVGKFDPSHEGWPAPARAETIPAVFDQLAADLAWLATRAVRPDDADPLLEVVAGIAAPIQASPSAPR